MTISKISSLLPSPIMILPTRSEIVRLVEIILRNSFLIWSLEKPDGCSTFFLRSKFVMYDKIEVEYDDLASQSTPSSSSTNTEESADPNEKRTGAVALILILQHIPDEKLIIVANTHLFWHPQYVMEWSLLKLFSLLEFVVAFQSCIRSSCAVLLPS